jgi:hypothetical protein
LGGSWRIIGIADVAMTVNVKVAYATHERETVRLS